jgi:hypothetical protein
MTEIEHPIYGVFLLENKGFQTVPCLGSFSLTTAIWDDGISVAPAGQPPSLAGEVNQRRGWEDTVSVHWNQR